MEEGEAEASLAVLAQGQPPSNQRAGFDGTDPGGYVCDQSGGVLASSFFSSKYGTQGIPPPWRGGHHILD